VLEGRLHDVLKEFLEVLVALGHAGVDEKVRRISSSQFVLRWPPVDGAVRS
jgi:hypothetical protein